MTTLNEFYRNIIEKSSLVNEHEFSKIDFLNEICSFFDMSHGFIYEISTDKVFQKTYFYRPDYANVLEQSLDLKSILGTELLSELSTTKIIVSCGENKENSELEKKLHSIFSSSTLILIPVLNQHFELSAFVGICDRRKKIRKGDLDVKNACSILSLLANRIKVEMYKKSTQNAERILNNVLDNVNIDIYVNDYYTHDILYVNKSMAAPYGGIDNMMGKKCWGSIFSDKLGQCDFCPQHKLLDENNEPTKVFSWDYQRMLDGNWFRVFSSCIPWTDGRLAHLVASVDITDNKKNELLIKKLAKFDHLTGLPNRRSLDDDIVKFIDDTTLFAPAFYVLFCDLDGFKKINDTIGHNAGDALLKEISKKLSELPEKYLRAYRHGGDEFVILVKDFDSAEFLKQILDELFEIFCNVYEFEEHEMSCGCSIGVSHFPRAGKKTKVLFHMADAAMYSSKTAGKGTVRFATEDVNYLTFDEYFSKT